MLVQARDAAAWNRIVMAEMLSGALILVMWEGELTEFADRLKLRKKEKNQIFIPVY